MPLPLRLLRRRLLTPQLLRQMNIQFRVTQLSSTPASRNSMHHLQRLLPMAMEMVRPQRQPPEFHRILASTRVLLMLRLSLIGIPQQISLHHKSGSRFPVTLLRPTPALLLRLLLPQTLKAGPMSSQTALLLLK